MPLTKPSDLGITGPRAEHNLGSLSSSSSEAEDDISALASGSEESDFLDSDEPRKRRRASPAAADDSDNDDEKRPVPVNIGSRTGRRQSQTTAAPPPSEPEREPQRILVPTDPTTSFESLGVRPWLLQSLANRPSPVPQASREAAFPRSSVATTASVEAELARVRRWLSRVPILQKWADDPSAIFAVVLTPTR